MNISMPKKQKHNKQWVYSFVKHFSMIIISAYFILPIVLMIYKSVEGKGLGNYIAVFERFNISLNFFNSLIVTVLTITSVVVITTLAAFAFSKLEFRFKKLLYLYLLIALMIPLASILLPVFKLIKGLGLINNILSLVGPYTALIAPFNLLILKNYIDDIPNQILESAFIDGCNKLQILYKIVLPLCKPALVVIILWTFLSSWNEFMMAYVFLSKTVSQTITVIPSKLKTMFFADVPKIYATLTVIVAPVITLYIFLQKYFEEGFTAGALKE